MTLACDWCGSTSNVNPRRAGSHLINNRWARIEIAMCDDCACDADHEETWSKAQ